jgi:hypothetical protein
MVLCEDPFYCATKSSTELGSSSCVSVQITTQPRPDSGLGDGFAIKYAMWFFADNPLAAAVRQSQSCFS